MGSDAFRAQFKLVSRVAMVVATVVTMVVIMYCSIADSDLGETGLHVETRQDLFANNPGKL